MRWFPYNGLLNIFKIKTGYLQQNFEYQIQIGSKKVNIYCDNNRKNAFELTLGLPKFSMNIGINFAIYYSNSFEFCISGIISNRNWLALSTITITISVFGLLFNSASYYTYKTYNYYVLKHDSIPTNNCTIQSVKAAIVMRFSTTTVCMINSRACNFDSNGILLDGYRFEDDIDAAYPPWASTPLLSVPNPVALFFI